MQGLRRIVVIGFDWEPDGPVPAELSAALKAGGFEPADLAVHRSLASPRGCGYLYPAPDTRSIDDRAFERLHLALGHHLPRAGAARLQSLMEIDGASVHLPATHHYVVQTDVQPQADAEFNAWYDREHMPGLAAVPGTVRAARYRNLDDGPRYHACYELATQNTFGSAPWLAVRATDWSSRVRPAFVNTRRIMFRTT